MSGRLRSARSLLNLVDQNAEAGITLTAAQTQILGYKPFISPLAELSCRGVTDLYATLAIDRLHLREIASSIIGTNYITT